LGYESNLLYSSSRHSQQLETLGREQNVETTPKASRSNSYQSTASVGNSSGKNKDVKCRKLVVTLPADERSRQRELHRIRFEGAEFGVIEEQPMENENALTLVFQDNQTAVKAVKKYRRAGFKIAMKFSQRPCPRQPIKYISLEDLTIRKGKALSQDVVGMLQQGKIVIVNQLKGRRARLIKPNKKDWGWVSMYSREDGRRLLAEVYEGDGIEI